MRIKCLCQTGLLVAALVAQRASAQFIQVDNFSGETAGDLAGQTASSGGTWTGLGAAGAVNIGTSATTGSQAALGQSVDGAAYIVLPTSISSGSTAATVFFQFDLGSSQAANNVNWSVENIGTATDGGGASANNVIELNADAPSRVGVTIRNGGAFDELSADGSTVFSPANSTLYNIWYVVNNSAKTYQLYMSGGSLGSTPTLMSIATGAYSATPSTFTTTGAFRNSSVSAINDFVFGQGGTGNSAYEGLYVLYEDPNGANLANPVVAPEPGTLALAGLSAAALALARRRRAARGN